MKKLALLLSIVLSQVAIQNASALELDWSGQFRSEFNYIKTYTLDGGATGVDPNRLGKGGYYVPWGGSNNAQFEDLFMKLQPKAVVNDNITIKSEFWLGDPVYGFFGGASPYTLDQKQYYSTNSRGSVVTAQRFWAEILTDFGTIKIGRAPLNYGLGLVWDAGDGMWDHYESTGDVVSLVSKFGAFSFIPSFVSYSTGNNVGGNCIGPTNTAGGTCSPTGGSGALNDYSLELKYENLDDDFDAGLNFIRRIAGGAQDPTSGYFFNGSAQSINYNTYDVYLHKKLGKFDLSAEVPVVSGSIAGIPYSTWALAGNVDWRLNDPWEFILKFGRAPGQPDSTTQQPGSYKGFYFNQDYQIALIMFNYQFANFAGPNNQNNPNVTPGTTSTTNGVGNPPATSTGSTPGLVSPYDNPLTNANYLTISPTLHADKWKFHATYAFAQANQTAQAGQWFWNTVTRQYVNNTSGTDQDGWLGWEMDYGADFQYDQYFVFGATVGFWFPGGFYAFNPNGTSNATNTVMAAQARVGVQF